LSHSNATGDSDKDIWEAFDEAIERAEQQLERAWENHEVVQQTDDPLSDEYISALTELEEATQQFDSVYEVTDSGLERAQRTATTAEFLATATQAYREYHESVIERRVRVIREWFDVLTSCVEDTNIDIAVNQSSLQRDMQALEKLTNARKYARLLDSDRIDLSDIETRTREFDEAVRDEASTEVYVPTGLELTDSFQDQYTDDLAELVQEGVNKDTISITDRVSDVPEPGSIATRLESGDVNPDDADIVSDTVETYADVTVLTGKRRAKYELGKKLISAVKDSPLSGGTDVEEDLRLRLNSFQLKPIENLVCRLIEGEATTSDMEQLLQLLAKYDGSVRRTAESLDQSTDELFDGLHDLFLQDEIADLEVRFE
jgi:antitoxin component HigA of HigAB toxin-antitoxin module